MPRLPFVTDFGPGAPASHTGAPAQEGISLPGFFGNLLGGVRNTVTGLSGIISGVGSDVIKLAQGNTHDLFTPHFATSLPGALIGDYAQRYGSPSKLAHGLYEDPLAYLFDALGAGDIAAKGAELAAARGVDTALTRAILPTERSILRHPDYTGEVPQIASVIDKRNPVTRFIVNSVRDTHALPGGHTTPSLFLPLENLQQQVGILESLGPKNKEAVARAKLYQAAIDKAQASGVSIYERPLYAKHRVKQAIIKLRSITQTNILGDRHAMTAEVNEMTAILDPLGDLPNDVMQGVVSQGFFGIGDHGLNQFSPEELIPQLQDKQFASLEDARQAVWSGTDPRVMALGHDEVAAIRRSTPPPSVDWGARTPQVRMAWEERLAREGTQRGHEVQHALAPVLDYVDSLSRTGGLDETLIRQVYSGESRGIADQGLRMLVQRNRRVLQDSGLIDEFNTMQKDYRIIEAALPNIGYERWARPLQLPDLSTAPAVQPIQDITALQAASERAKTTFLDSLRQMFGAPSVKVRVKPYERLVEKGALDGAAPTDALGARITVADWKDAPAVLEQLGGKFQIAAIDDTRAGRFGDPSWDGQRRLAATVMTPEGVMAEVEIGTPEFSLTRDALSPFHHSIDRQRGELAQAEAVLNDPAQVAQLRQKDYEALVEQVGLLHRAIETGRMGIQATYEHVADEIAQQALGHALPGGVQRQVFGQYRRWVMGRLTKPMLESGMFDAAKAFDAAYVPLRMESGAEWDPAAAGGQGDFVGGLSSTEIHKARMAQDLPMPIYFPFYDMNRLKVSDFLAGINLNSGFMKRINRPTFLRTRTGELYEKGTWVADPRDALIRRGMAALRVREMGDFYRRLVEEFGRPTTESEIGTGEFYTAPMGTLQFFNAHIGLTDRLLKSMTENLKLTNSQVAQIIEEFQPKIERNIVGITKQGVQGYAIPKIVRDMAEKHVIIPGYENAIRLFWDTPMKMWRSLVLTARPAWVANNVLGSAVFTKMQGGSLVRVARQVSPSYRRAFKEIVPEEQRYGLSTGLFASQGPEAATHLGMASQTGPGRFYDAMSRSWHSNRVTKKLSTWGEKVRHFNMELEGAFRREAFLTAAEKQGAIAGATKSLWRFKTSYEDLRRIAQRGINPEAADKALQEAYYFHNDYEALGPFEQGYVRRFLVPFYSFFKHVTRLAIRYPGDYGLRNLVGTQAARFDTEMQREMYGAMPAWLRGATPLGPIGPIGTEQSFFSGGAANPFSTLNPVSQMSFFSLLYPTWKITAEQTTGRSTLTGRQFTDANVYVPFGTEQEYRIVKGPDGEVLDSIPISNVAPGLGESLLQQVPFYNLAKQVVAGGRTYDTETLGTVLKDRVLGRSPLAQGSSGTTLPISILSALGKYLGVPTYPYDLSKGQANMSRGAAEAALGYLRTRGSINGPVGAAPVPPALQSQSSQGPRLPFV